MSKQAQNFITLVKGNPVSQIKRALGMLQPKVKNELMSHYNANSIDELAIKLA